MFSKLRKYYFLPFSHKHQYKNHKPIHTTLKDIRVDNS